MAGNTVDIRITASGAEQAARVLASVAKEGGELGSIVASGAKKADDAITSLSASAKRLGESLESAGRKLSVSLTAPIAAFAAGITVAGIAIDDAMDRIRAGTGATGDALNTLGADFRAVLTDATASASQVSGALVRVNKALDLNGQPLRDLTTQMLTLARITESDVNTVIESSVKVFNNWGIAVEQQADALDFLFKAAQATGTGIIRLMEGVTSAGPILRTFGISFEQTTAIVSQMERAGLDSTSAIAGMRKALQELKDRGVTDTAAGLAQLIAEIQNSKNAAEAGARALDLFGGRGFAFGEAIRLGKLNVEEFVKTLRESPETITKAGEETLSFADKLQQLKNKLTLAAETMGTPFLKILEDRVLPVLLQVTDGIGKVGAAMAQLPESAQLIIVGAVAMVAALGPLLAVIGLMVKIIPLAIAGFAALATAFTVMTGGTGLIVLALAAAALGIGGVVLAMKTVPEAADKAALSIGLLSTSWGILNQTMRETVDAGTMKGALDTLANLPGAPGPKGPIGAPGGTDTSGAAASLAALKGQADVAASAIEAAAARGTIAIKDAVAQRITLAEDAAVIEAAIAANAAEQQLASYTKLLGGFKGKLEERAAIEAKISDLTVKNEQAAGGVRQAVWARADVDLKKFVETLNSGIDTALAKVTNGVDDQARALREGAEAEQRFTDAMGVMMGGLDGSATAFDSLIAAAKGDLVNALTAAEKELRALKETLGQTGPEAEVLRDFLMKTGVSVTDLDERTKRFLATFGQTKAQIADTRSAETLTNTLEANQRSAALLGHEYDLLAANLATYQKRILELQAIKNPTGDTLAEITRLKGAFADTKDLIFWRDAVKDVFGSISSAISTSVQGVILGTTTMAKAWENLWKSIVLSFVNSGIQRLLKGLTDWVLDFFSGTSSGGAGSGILGAIVAGAGALFSKLGGGGTSLGNPVGSSAAALDQVTTAAKGTASALNVANTGVSNFSAGVGAALSGLGVAAGIYGLTKGGSPASMAFSAGGTALSLYSLSVSASQLAVNAGLIGTALPSIGVLLAQGLASVAPTIAAAVGTAVYSAFGSSAVATALLGGGTAAAGAGAAGAGAGAAIAGAAGASFLGFVAFMAAGGFAGIAADAEDAAASFKEQMDAVQEALNKAGAAGLLFANLGKNLQESKLAASLEQLHGALRALGDLDLAVGLNQVLGDASAQGITAQVPKLRATVGAAWLAAMDAAVAQGLPIPSRSPGRDLTAPWAGAVGMQSFDDMLAQSAGAGRDGFDKLTNLLEHISQSLDTSLYQVNATGVRMVDLGAVNALLDKEFLTTSLRNAVVDIGALFGITAGQMGGIGAGEGNWRGTPGAGNMPSIAAIASAQAALEAAGFEPGKYGEALEAYLTSIDMNLVNNPAWKKFVDMLHRAGGSAGGLVAAINAALGQAMTPTQFYGVAKAATDSLTAALKAQMTARASETDTDALKAIDDSIAAMTETVKAWSSLVTLYTGLPVEMAAISGDLVKQTEASIEAWRVQMQSFTDAIVDSRKALDEAIAGGNIASIAAAAQAVHDQTIGQYNAVLKAVESIHQAIQGLLEQAGVLVDMMTSVAQLDIRSNGSFATIGSLLGSLQDIAEHGGTAAIRLFAVNKAIEAIIATLPTALEKFGSEGGAGAITGAVTGAASPFLAAQQGAINQAQGAAQLALLQQQAQTINALAAAVIAGIQQALSAALKAVRETADATIAGLTRERDAKLKAIDDEIGGIETEAARRHELHAQEIEAIQNVAKLYHDKAMAEIAAIETTAKAAHESRMAEIDAIQEAEDAAHEYRAAEMDALSELINKAQAMESAVASMGKFIDALKKGPLGPGNPADKLSMAQQSFAQALTAFNKNPTAGGLTDLQDLAQTMLSLAEPILSKPSPAFQTLSANTIKQLLAAQALARAQMTDSQILKAQLEHLQAIDKATSANVREQIKAIQAADEAAGKKADAMIEAIKARDEKEQAQAAALIKGIEDLDKMEQTIARAMIDTLNENKAQVGRDFETQTTAIEAAVKAQILAIERAAADEIDHVQKGTAAALQANMQAQIPLLEAQYNAANAQLAAIGDTKTWQDATLAKLEALRVLLAGATGAESGMTRVTEGLYHLHDDEMVLPKAMADKIRSAQEGAGLPSSTPEDWKSKWFQPRDLGVESKIWSGPSADVLNDLERRILLLQAQYEGTVAHNEYKSGGKSYKHYNAAQLSAKKAEMDAQVATLRQQQKTIQDALPTTTVPPPGAPPPGAPPPGTPPTPYTPPGPPWLTRPPKIGGTDRLGTYGGGGYPDGGGGPITVVVKLDGKTIGEATLPTIQGDARSGKMRTIILETKAR